jgi:hypothetical protein
MFVLVFGGIIGWVGWTALSSAMTGGVVNRGDYYDVDLKYISLFPLDQQTGVTADVPERFRGLDGKKVVLVGEMWAPNAAGPAVGSFDLCYSIAKCCFSGPPQVQERVFVVAKKDIPIYDMYTFAEVVGTLHVRVIKDPTSGKITSVYDLDCESAKAL